LFYVVDDDPTPQQTLLFAAATSINIHDPWSMPFAGLSATSTLDESERVLKKIRPVVVAPTLPPRPKKYARPKTEAEAAERDQKLPGSASWAGLPSSMSWVRAFVDDGNKTRLSFIPSMANPAYVPHAVATARQVWVHAQMSHYTCCPRLLMGNPGFIHQHTNTGLLYCFEDATGAPRCWIRCFSPKCIAGARQDRQRERGWTEIYEQDLDMLRFMQRGEPQPQPSPPPPPKPQPKPQPKKTEEVEDVWQGIPPVQAAWISEPWRGITLTRDAARPFVPACVFKRECKVILHATVPNDDGLLCPRRLVRDRVRHFHQSDNGPDPYRIIVVEQSSPKCAGRSYRLFVRCTHTDCAHITGIDTRDPKCPWTELTRLTLQTQRAE
jgi:hypothetical protein